MMQIAGLIINVIFYWIMNLKMYTDRAVMPNGQIRKWQRSPAERIHTNGQDVLLYVQLAFAIVSIVTGILILLGVKKQIVKTIWLIAIIASAIFFIVIMIASGNAHSHYGY